ncbi:MAG: glucosyl transferase [Ignavibacteriaceae bacterium]
MKIFLAFYLTVLSLLFFNACNTTEPPPVNEYSLNLKLEDVSCTEAWIQFSSTNIQIPNNISLFVNGNVKKTFTLNTKDSLLYIDSLLANQTYKITATMQQSNNASNELTLTTMDTTSHNFNWQTWTFGGQAGSCALYDVAIIDENNIWAVGEIYMNDSLGNPDPIAYNAIYWNGREWKVKKIAVTYNGNQTIAPLKGIFVLPSGEIIFSSGLPYLPQGNGWKLYHLWDMGVLDQNDGSVDRIWGTSLNDLYFAGSKGTIVHYGGSLVGWTKIESGTTTNINDAWGVFENGTSTVFCPVSSIFNPPQDKKILKIVDGKVYSVSWSKDRILYSCWTNSNNFLYACGEGVYVYNFGTWEQITLPAITTNSVRGNDINDIFIDGDYGFIAHFNGKSWHIYSNNYLKGYSRLSFKGDIVAIAGNYQGKAIIEIGRRN